MSDEPKTIRDFEYIYNADGTCHQWDCSAQGLVLAYDDFSPEGALWFCSYCWQEYEDKQHTLLTIVEDRRIITNVYLFHNGMVMTFDQQGVQMPALQGPLEEVYAALHEPHKGDWTFGNMVTGWSVEVPWCCVDTLEHTLATQVVLTHRTKGWRAQSIGDVPVPDALPYAQGATAYAVCIMKQWNELGDEPAWLAGCDQGTHDLYYRQRYEEMGEAALATWRIECDLAIHAQGAWHIFLCPPERREQAGGGYSITFAAAFPKELPEIEESHERP